MKIQIDPDGHPTAPFPAGLDLAEKGFEIIELGIRDLVRVLWKLGFRSACSCAGHEIGIEPFPWVAIPINLEEETKPLEKLAGLIAGFNMSMGKNGHLPDAIDTWVMNPLYCPDGFAIYLQPLDMNPTHNLKRISELRKASQALATFMEKNS